MALAVYKIFCSPTLWIQRYSSPVISFIWPVSFRHPLMHRAKMNPWFLASGSQSAQQHYSSYGRGRMRQDVDEWVSASDPGLLVVHLPVDGLGFHPCQTTIKNQKTKNLQKQSGHPTDAQIALEEDKYVDFVAEFICQTFLFAVASTTVIYQYHKKATEDSKNVEIHKHEMESSKRHVHDLSQEIQKVVQGLKILTEKSSKRDVHDLSQEIHKVVQGLKILTEKVDQLTKKMEAVPRKKKRKEEMEVLKEMDFLWREGISKLFGCSKDKSGCRKPIM